jgi:hypothetical protein
MQINQLTAWWILLGRVFICSSHVLNSSDTFTSVSRIRRSDFPQDFRSLASNSFCDHEIKLLESNRELTESLENVMVDLESAFNTVYYGGFCKFAESDVDQSVTLQCIMDYNQFSSEFISLCHDNGGDSHPISFLTSCQSDHLDLEMELLNVPSCLGKSCSSLELNTAILKVVKMTETSLNERLEQTLKNAKCKFYHDYDLTMQPNSYILTTERDGKGTRKRNSKDLPAYIWGLIVVGVAISVTLSIVFYHKQNTSSRRGIDGNEALTSIENSGIMQDCFHDNYYDAYINDAKKQVSNLMATVRIYHEKYSTKYEDVPFDEAIEIEYE